MGVGVDLKVGSHHAAAAILVLGGGFEREAPRLAWLGSGLGLGLGLGLALGSGLESGSGSGGGSGGGGGGGLARRAGHPTNTNPTNTNPLMDGATPLRELSAGRSDEECHVECRPPVALRTYESQRACRR